MGYAIQEQPVKSRRRTSSSSEKSASGDFFDLTEKSRLENRCEALETHQENSSTATKNALGVHYYKYRHYKADYGRWLGRDPLGDEMFLQAYVKECNEGVKCEKKREAKLVELTKEGQKNLYAFVGSDVLNIPDQDGLFGFMTPDKAIAMVKIAAAKAGMTVGQYIKSKAKRKKKKGSLYVCFNLCSCKCGSVEKGQMFGLGAAKTAKDAFLAAETAAKAKCPIKFGAGWTGKHCGKRIPTLKCM